MDKSHRGASSLHAMKYLNVCVRMELVESNKDGPLPSPAVLSIVSVYKRKQRWKTKTEFSLDGILKSGFPSNLWIYWMEILVSVSEYRILLATVFAVENFWYENYLRPVAERLTFVIMGYYLAFFKVHFIFVKSQLSMVFPGTDVIM